MMASSTKARNHDVCGQAFYISLLSDRSKLITNFSVSLMWLSSPSERHNESELGFPQAMQIAGAITLKDWHARSVEDRGLNSRDTFSGKNYSFKIVMGIYIIHVSYCYYVFSAEKFKLLCLNINIHVHEHICFFVLYIFIYILI